MGCQFNLCLLLIFSNFLLPKAANDESIGGGGSSESSQAAELFSTTAEIFEEEEAIVPERRPKASCDVFDPFKVLPTDPGHFQIGGAFPLHKEDCLELSPSSVQDVVAVQWAMAYWNEQKKTEKGEENEKSLSRPKLGLFAGDSCSRPKEAISQTLRFLDSIGFHEPSECLANNAEMTSTTTRRRNSATPKLIGILAPKDRESAEAVAQSFQPTFLPIGVYSLAAGQAFLDAKVPGGFITTVPLFGDFIRTLLELIKMLDSNLVSIVDYGDEYVPTQKLIEQFRQNNISIAEVVAFDHSLMPSILAKSDSKIIISLVSNQILGEAEIGQNLDIQNLQKLWINLELEIDEGNNEGKPTKRMDFLVNGEGEIGAAKLQTITIRRQQRYLTDFNAYFLRVLVANYEHYSLLNSYVQYVYNCTQGLAKFPGNKRTKAICGKEQLEPKRLAKLHRQSNSIESAINLIYAFAKVAERIEGDEGKREKCGTPNPSCFDLIRQEILKIVPNDQNNNGRLPPGFGEQLNGMHFFETKEGAIQMAGIGIEAILTEKEGRDGGNLYKLLEYRTGLDEKGQPLGNVQKFQMPTKLQKIHSHCQQFRPYCQDKCKLATQRRDDQTFLSMPQQFSLYVAAMFDFQNGPMCDRLRRENPASVALPLAFVHSMSTFRQRNSPKSTLFNLNEGAMDMDIGTILIDTCTNAQTLMEFLMDSERNCYKFSQVERNWTIASGATIGYVFGAEEIGSAQSGVLEAMFSQSTSTPIISIANEGNYWLKDGGGMEEEEMFGGIFTYGPSHSATALALSKFLRQMHWTYVNVVLDRSDPTSRATFKQFQKLSSSAICIAELTIIGEEGRQNGRNEEQTKNGKRSSAIHKSAGNVGQQFGMAVTSANVTLIFSGAKQAAEYMSTWLRDEFMASGTSTNVHVVVGDAHDFHLHDPTNLAQYAGTVSFQAKDVTSVEFQNWIRSITPLTLPEVWYWRHVEENWHCALSRSNIGRFHGRMCSGEELLDVNGMGRLAKAGYLARGVDKLLTAIDQIHLKNCGTEKMCDEFVKNGRKLVREILLKMANEEEDQFEVFQLIPTGNEGKIGYKLFANYSSPRHATNSNDKIGENKIHLVADYRPFPNGIQTNLDELRPIISRCRQPFCKCPSNNNNEFDGLDASFGKASSYIRREPARKDADNSEELLLVFENSDDPQVEELGGIEERELSDALRIIFLVLSALLCALAVATLLLILIKMYQQKIKGHQSLGIILLVGICGLYSSAFLFAISPNSDSICHLRIGLHALAHSLCFGVIIVKAIQLRNAETLALMGASAQQISYWNYWLLLMFILAVQIVICMKWLLLEPIEWATNRNSKYAAQIVSDSPSAVGRLLLCSYSSANFVLSQIYTFLLLLLALLLSAQNRGIKRNYKEAKWLFVTSFSCTLLLCAWALCHILVNPLYLDHMTVLELHLTGSLLLAFIFGPKLYVLLFYEPILVECAYGSSLNGARGGKSEDLFEGEWNHENAFSPTLSNRSSKINGQNEIGDEEEEKVTSAFQTILRKKMGGSAGKMNNENPSRTNSVQSSKNANLHCSMGTPRIGQKERADLGKSMSPQNV